MKERFFRKSFKHARIILASTVAFAACPGDDIAMFAAALGPAIPGGSNSSLDIYENTPHDAVLDRRGIEMKLPPIRISRLPRR